MAVINYNYSGLGSINSSFDASWTTTRGRNSGFIVTNPALSPEIRLQVSVGRGGTAFSLVRSFVFFNTNQFPALGTITAASITYNSAGSSGFLFCVLTESVAFGGGSGGSLANGDYGSPQFTPTLFNTFQWPGAGASISTTATAAGISFLQSGGGQGNGLATMATIQQTNDQQNVQPGVAFATDLQAQIAQGGPSDVSLSITYTPAPSFNFSEMNEVAAANITEINQTASANIAEVNQV
jgi:hypothetical protein